ncbi:hypothetical protein EH2_02797 [Bacillus subtilis]|nr:hypothetical protein EH2_02797 [Bacillus subtilis]
MGNKLSKEYNPLNQTELTLNTFQNQLKKTFSSQKILNRKK